MRRLVIVGAVVALASEAGAQPIVNGSADTTHQAVVAVHASASSWCSGTVIAVADDTAVVLTAAHCVPADRVIVGDDRDDPTASYVVLDERVHPAYATHGFPYDYALLRLVGVPSDLAWIPALTPAVDSIAAGTPLTLVGYGVTSPTGSTNTARRAFDAVAGQVTEVSIIFSNALGGTCFGDSGGPALTTGIERVAGVASFGDANCAVSSSEGRVSAVYDDFIAPYIGAPVVDAAPAMPPDGGIDGRDAAGSFEYGGGGGCCDAGDRDPTGAILLTIVVGAALAFGRKMGRCGARSRSM